MMPRSTWFLGLALLAIASTGVSRAFADPKDDLPVTPHPWGKLVEAGKADPRLKGFRVPEGIDLEIVAETPVRLLAIQADGTPVIATSARAGGKGTLQALRVAKSGGVWEAATKLLEDDHAVRDMLVHDGWVYLAGKGGVRRSKASKPEGPFDVQGTVLTGAGLVASGMTLGLDGMLYTSIPAGDWTIAGSDGSKVIVRRTGAILRCRPDGSRLEIFAIGLARPQGPLGIDLAGNLFCTEQDGSASRLLHVSDQGDLGWRMGSANAAAVPGAVPALRTVRGGRFGGVSFYEDSRLPAEFRGLLLVPDAQAKSIRAFQANPFGASFRVAAEHILLSAPEEKRFLPGAPVVGPDGALYVPDRGLGRIYRLRWGGTKDRPALALRGMAHWAKIGQAADEKLIEAIKSEEGSERRVARQECAKRGEKNRPALLGILEDEDAPLGAKLDALGALEWMYDDSVRQVLLRSLAEGDGELQRVAAEALGRHAKKGDRATQDGLLRSLAIEDRGIRRAVALAMGRLAGPGGADNLARAISFDDAKDGCLAQGLARAIEMLGRPGIDALLSLADSGVTRDLGRVVGAYEGFRTRNGIEALPRLLDNPHLTSDQRAALIRACRNCVTGPAVSLDNLAGWLATQKETPGVRSALLEVMGIPGTTSGPVCETFVLRALQDDSEDVREQALAATGRLQLGKGIDPVKGILSAREPTALRRQALRTLAILDAKSASAQARNLLADKDPLLQREAIQVLGATPEGALEMGRLIQSGKLPTRVRLLVIQALEKHQDADAKVAQLLRALREPARKP